GEQGALLMAKQSVKGAGKSGDGDPPVARRSAPRRPLQERGRARFEALLDTVEAMLVDQEPDQIGFYQIAERAGMAAASVYHFFPTKSAVFVALADRYFNHFRQAALEVPEDGDIRAWQDFVRARHRRAVAYYNAHPPAMKLILGAQPFLEIRSEDSSVNKEVSQQALAHIGRRFHLPRLVDPEMKFLISVSLADAVWRISYTEHGCITEPYAAEATRATLAYLHTFLPEALEPRG
ncbi:MAG: TetR/AcrR family transcriptional regulator, partial [Caulobacteraceae bacterium]|nr:TetR/AcrR family transcriptional regulator [Caulobacteraceae bacterium]